MSSRVDCGPLSSVLEDGSLIFTLAFTCGVARRQSEGEVMHVISILVLDAIVRRRARLKASLNTAATAFAPEADHSHVILRLNAHYQDKLSRTFQISSPNGGEDVSGLQERTVTSSCIVRFASC